MARNFRLILLSCVFLGSVGAVWGIENHWTGAAGDNLWTNSANWSLGVLPNSTQDVFIDETTNAVLLNSYVEAGRFTLGGNQGLATLNISNGTLSVYVFASIQTNGVLNLAGSVTGTGLLRMDGVINSTNGSFSCQLIIGSTGILNIAPGFSTALAGLLVNNGLISGCGSNLLTATPTSITLNFGTIFIANANGGVPSTLKLYNNFTNSGKIVVESNAVLEVKSGPGSAVAFTGGTVFEGPGLTRLTTELSALFSGIITVNGPLEYAAAAPSDGTSHSFWTGPSGLQWKGGMLSEVTFMPGFETVAMPGGSKFLAGSCTNQGQFRWREPGYLRAAKGTRFNNEGNFILETNCVIFDYYEITNFNNFGIIQTLPDAGNVQLYLNTKIFTNGGSFQAATNSVLQIVFPVSQGVGEFQDGTTFNGMVKLQEVEDSEYYFKGNMTVNGTLDYSVAAAAGANSVWGGPGLFLFRAYGLNGFTFAPGFHVEAISGVYKTVGSLNTNFGTLRWADGSGFVQPPNSFFYNYGELIIESNFMMNVNISTASNVFVNLGTITVPANSGTVPIVVSAIGFTNRGIIEVESNAVLQVQANDAGGLSLEDGTVFNGAGTTRFLGNAGIGSLLAFSGTQTVNGGVELSGATCAGNAVWSGPGLLQWRSGSMSNFTFAPMLTVELLSSGTKSICGACTNQGTTRWLGDGVLSSACGATFVNSGLLQIETNGTWNSSVVLSNRGTLHQTAGQFTLGTLVNGGTVELDAGLLNLTSAFIASDNGMYVVRLGGYAPETGFGKLIGQQANLAGSLNVSLTNNFSPTNGSSFLVASSSIQAGTFSSATLPSLPSNLCWRISYASNSVLLKVFSPTTLEAVQMAGGNFQFNLTGSPGGCEIQASTNLVHWTTLHTDATFSGSLLFTDTNAVSFPQRFYRARLFD